MFGLEVAMVYLIIWLLFGVLTAVAANSRGRDPTGWFFIGVLLGPFGLILVLVMKPNSEDLPQHSNTVSKSKDDPAVLALIEELNKRKKQEG